MIFLGCLFDRRKEAEILKLSNNVLQNSSATFQWNIIDGLLENGQRLSIINILPVGVFPKYFKKCFLKTKRWSYGRVPCKEIGCINLPFIKQYQRYKKCRKELLRSKDNEILIYSTYEPFLRAVSKLPKNYKVSLIVPDLPEFYDLSKVGFVRRIVRKINNRRIYRYLGRIDRYILLTEHMKDKLPIGDKPYVVVEGVVNDMEKKEDRDAINDETKVILYVGSYRMSNGIKQLVEAFSGANERGWELWLCGKGEATQFIEKWSRKDSRIKDLGYKKHDEALELEKRADLLVNPRRNIGEYTKYSFPSKTMEYMASGTPVLMYKLDGIPKEYDNYIYYVDGDNVDDLKKMIEKLISKPQLELDKFGKKAKKWVLENKNAKVQTKKIIELINAHE